ncbi:hypothetical protein Q9966_010995 [Columba livia]|nr:hypothetical protein Q9966_010995 [Columba livia]
MIRDKLIRDGINLSKPPYSNKVILQCQFLLSKWLMKQVMVTWIFWSRALDTDLLDVSVLLCCIPPWLTWRMYHLFLLISMNGKFFKSKGMFTIDSGRYVGSDHVALYHETDGNFAVDVVGNKLSLETCEVSPSLSNSMVKFWMVFHFSGRSKGTENLTSKEEMLFEPLNKGNIVANDFPNCELDFETTD